MLANRFTLIVRKKSVLTVQIMEIEKADTATW